MYTLLAYKRYDSYTTGFQKICATEVEDTAKRRPVVSLFGVLHVVDAHLIMSGVNIYMLTVRYSQRRDRT
jgi:hypothetical protein